MNVQGESAELEQKGANRWNFADVKTKQMACLCELRQLGQGCEIEEKSKGKMPARILVRVVTW